MYRDPLQLKKAQAAWYVKNKQAVKAKSRKSYLTRRALHLIWEAKRRAQRKGVPYSLDPPEIQRIQSVIDLGYCEMTGSPFDLETQRAWNSPSLDQIIAGQGYVVGNVRVVCRAMNFAMGTWGPGPVLEMFQNWARLMGLPIEFSNCADMAMRSARKLRRSTSKPSEKA